MSYYSKERCYLCGSKMDCIGAADYICQVEDCSYVVDEMYITFELKVGNDNYLIDLSHNLTEILKDELDDNGFSFRKALYKEEKFLELSVQQWKDLISRLKHLEAFK